MGLRSRLEAEAGSETGPEGDFSDDEGSYEYSLDTDANKKPRLFKEGFL